MEFVRKVVQLDLKLAYSPTSSLIADVSKMLKVNYYKLGILLDLDCPGSEEILRQVCHIVFIVVVKTTFIS